MLLACEYSIFDPFIYYDSATDILSWLPVFDFFTSGTSRWEDGEGAGEGEGEGDWLTRFGLLLLENSLSAYEFLELLLP